MKSLADVIGKPPYREKMLGRKRRTFVEPRIAAELLTWAIGPSLRIEQASSFVESWNGTATLRNIQPTQSPPIRRQSMFEKAVLFAFPNHTMLFDKCISPTCKLRPDILILTAWGYIVIEIDEKQHRQYEHEAERESNIRTELKKPVMFIRVNPDKYVDEKGKTWTSIIGYHGLDEKVDKCEFMRRWRVIHPVVNNAILSDTCPCDVSLFFDAYTHVNHKWNTLK